MAGTDDAKLESKIETNMADTDDTKLKSATETNIGHLPREMLIEVMKNVGRAGKRNSRLVCFDWTILLNHPNCGIVHYTARIYGTEALQTLLNSGLEYSLVKIKGLQEVWTEEAKKLIPKITGLQIAENNSETTVVTFLKSSEFLEYLQIDLDAFGQLGELTARVELPGLMFEFLWAVSLSVHFSQDTKAEEKKHSDALYSLFRHVKLPSLRTCTFDLTSYEQNEISENVVKIMSAFWFLTENHAETLTELSFMIYFDSATLLPPSGPLNSKINPTPIMKIETISIFVTHANALTFLVPPSVWLSMKVRKLTWSPFASENDIKMTVPNGMPNPLEPLITRNKRNLQEMSLRICVNGSRIFFIDWLNPCSVLTKLTLQDFHNCLGSQIRIPSLTVLSAETLPLHMGHGCAWIAGCFRNLKHLKIRTFSFEENGNCTWLGHLIRMTELIKIEFATFFMSGPVQFDGAVQNFCNAHNELTLITSPRVDNVGTTLIKINRPE